MAAAGWLHLNLTVTGSIAGLAQAVPDLKKDADEGSKQRMTEAALRVLEPCEPTLTQSLSLSHLYFLLSASVDPDLS